jgi:hypothetical protein
MEEINLAGEVFGDDEKISASDLKPDSAALDQMEKSSRPRGNDNGQGGNARQGGQGAGGGGPGGGGFDREAMMKRLDTDGDGTISEAEREAARKQFQGGQGRPQ